MDQVQGEAVFFFRLPTRHFFSVTNIVTGSTVLGLAVQGVADLGPQVLDYRPPPFIITAASDGTDAPAFANFPFTLL